MVYFLTTVLLLEFRMAIRLFGPFSWPWWWVLAPLSLLFAVMVVTLAGLAAVERVQRPAR